MLLQKTTVSKIGSRDSKPNLTKPKYYVSDNHEPIVSKETFNVVQEIIKNRAIRFYTPPKVKTDFEYANYVYSIIGQKFYKNKINHRNTKHEIKLLEVLDNNRNRVLDAKNIYYSQIDKLLDEGANALLKSKFIKDEINDLLEKTIKASGVDDMINELTLKAESLNNELSNLNSLKIDTSARNQIKEKLKVELSEVNAQFLTLRYKKLMNYTYEKNIPLFMRKLKDLKNKRDVDLKEIFSFVIAKDRDNLILCIHLSNRNINEIDLNGEIDNIPLKSGKFNFIQTRLHIDVNWKIIVI